MPPRRADDLPDTPAQDIADAFDRALRDKRLTNRAVARAAKVSDGAVSGWLSPDTDRDLVQWRRLADVCRKLGLSADEVLGLTPPRGPQPQAVAEAVSHLDQARALLLAAAQDAETVADLAENLDERVGNESTRADRDAG